MRVVDEEFIRGKRVLLRLDTDVALKEGKVLEDFRLKAGMPTLELCLKHAESVVVMGHLGRPNPPAGGEDPSLSIKPVVSWLQDYFQDLSLPEGKLHVLENLRFEVGEDECSEDFAKELAELGDVFVNESFAAHHKSASTTVLPKLIPSAAGLRFAKEVSELTKVRENPTHPQVAIIGGAKVDDKYPAILALAKFCDAVLVGGLLPKEIKDQNLEIERNVMLGKLNEVENDLAEESVEAFIRLIKNAKKIIWAGPVGKFEDESGKKGTLTLAQAVIDCGAESIIGGGDTQAALNDYLDQFSFVSTGGGAMLKLLTEGTLPTIEALK